MPFPRVSLFRFPALTRIKAEAGLELHEQDILGDGRVVGVVVRELLAHQGRNGARRAEAGVLVVAEHVHDGGRSI